MTINKEAIAKHVQKELDLKNYPEAQRTVDAVFSVIEDAIRRGEDVKIVGYGSHTFKDQDARTAKNPQTGEEVSVAAYAKHKFTLASGLKKESKENTTK